MGFILLTYLFYAGLLEQVLTYVEEVLAGKITGDPAIGRALLDMVNSVPKMTQQEFETMFTSNTKVNVYWRKASNV